MNATTEITNTADIIDSRDVIARIEELEQESEYTEELHALHELTKEAEGYSEDWEFGAQLIRDSYFKEYAQELANDIGAINANADWPNNCIDWEEAAEQLKIDYTSVEFDGVEYWVR